MVTKSNLLIEGSSGHAHTHTHTHTHAHKHMHTQTHAHTNTHKSVWRQTHVLMESNVWNVTMDTSVGAVLLVSVATAKEGSISQMPRPSR